MPPKKKLILLGIISYVLISANIGGYSIYILDEAKNAGCALEMLATGDFIVPVLNGELRTDKPPLHYYFMMAGYQLFGATPFAARFFSAIFGVLTVLLTYLFARRFVNEATANFTVLTLLSSLGFIMQFHLATPDPYLIFFITATLMGYFYFDQTKDPKSLYLAYAATGLGTLAKGPVAIALPAIAIFFYLLTKGKLNLREISQLKPLLGLLIVTVIAAPWYLLVHFKTNGAWTEGFFIGHNIERFAEPMEGHGGSFLIPTLFLISLLLPLSLFLPQIIGKTWRNRKNDTVKFCAVSALCILLFFSLSGTKLPNYVSPAVPFVAVLIGYFLSQLFMAQKRWMLLGMFSLLLLSLWSWWQAYLFLKTHNDLHSVVDVAWFFGVIPAAAAAGFIFLLFRKKTKAIYSLCFGFIIFHQCFFYFMYPIVDRQNPVAQTLHYLRHSENIIYYKNINPAYIFGLQRVIPKANDLSDVQKLRASYEQGIIISRPKHAEELLTVDGLQVIDQREDLFDINDVLLIRFGN